MSIEIIDYSKRRKLYGSSEVAWGIGGLSPKKLKELQEKKKSEEKLEKKEQKSSKKLSPIMKKALEMGFIDGSEELNAPKGFSL